MIEIIRTNYQNRKFKNLVELLNADLAKRDGGTHPLSQFNSIAHLKHVVLAIKDDQAIGCGAISQYDDHSTEIKRMFVTPEVRGQRIGESILIELEKWARALGSNRCILFTGSNQPEASKLYQRNGYCIIPNYGKLQDIPDSLCFSKELQYTNSINS